jgi:glycosyltransferase involved in cell wall biosynthesis
MSELNVLYYSCPFDLSGYGTVARNHLIQMSKIKSIKTRLRTRKFWNGVAPDLKEDGDILHAMERNPISETDFVFIQHLTPENFYIDNRAKRHVCYTPFETDGAPAAWLLPLRGMDEIWVPSEHNKMAYTNVGLGHKKMVVIPHGVNPEIYNPNIKPLTYDRGAFNFGSVFDWTERKNPIALLRAYFNAFADYEDVTLSIRTFWRFPLEKTKEYVQSEIQRIKDSFSGRTKFPKIQCWFDTIDDSIMANFYKSMDCFVLPTRGEGFGLPLLEAMACGVPTIGPSIGGNREFMNNDNSFLVEGRMVKIDNATFLRQQPQYGGQKWFDIDEHELSKAMRWVYDNREEAGKIAAVGAKDVKEKFTWEIAAEKIHNRLLEIDGGA